MPSAVPRPLLGWPLLAVPDAAGQLGYPTLQESVRQSIKIILSTRPGERLMRPEFGGGLAEFLHEPNTFITRRRIRDRVTESIERWERRVRVNRVDVEEVLGGPTSLRVVISYQLLRTGDADQMGILVDLES